MRKAFFLAFCAFGCEYELEEGIFPEESCQNWPPEREIGYYAGTDVDREEHLSRLEGVCLDFELQEEQYRMNCNNLDYFATIRCRLHPPEESTPIYYSFSCDEMFGTDGDTAALEELLNGPTLVCALDVAAALNK